MDTNPLVPILDAAKAQQQAVLFLIAIILCMMVILFSIFQKTYRQKMKK